MLNQGYVLERASEGLLQQKQVQAGERMHQEASLNHCEDSRKYIFFFPTHHLKHFGTGNL